MLPEVGLWDRLLLALKGDRDLGVLGQGTCWDPSSPAPAPAPSQGAPGLGRDAGEDAKTRCVGV